MDADSASRPVQSRRPERKTAAETLRVLTLALHRTVISNESGMYVYVRRLIWTEVIATDAGIEKDDGALYDLWNVSRLLVPTIHQ